MTDPQLSETLAGMSARVEQYRGQGIGESNTKATLITPLLRALGWDVEDLNEVRLEYKRGPADKPVDYALLIDGVPRLFVEAKALGENLSDRRWASQIMGYASVAGVKWVVLTDGDEWRIFNSHAGVPVEEKLFRSTRVSDDASLPEETLSLLSKENISRMDALWQEDFVDRQVRTALEGLFTPEPDASLVRAIRRRVPTLSPSQVREALGRMTYSFRSPRTVAPSQLACRIPEL
jgi:hypothetical protein